METIRGKIQNIIAKYKLEEINIDEATERLENLIMYEICDAYDEAKGGNLDAIDLTLLQQHLKSKKL
jgi:hypothetical protein